MNLKPDFGSSENVCKSGNKENVVGSSELLEETGLLNSNHVENFTMENSPEKPKPWKKMSFREKCKHVTENITVEPMLACYIMPSVLAGLATQNLNLEKACRVNLHYGDHVCDALTRRETANFTEEEKMVQQIVAQMAGWKTILQSALPCLLILFWGSWSDRHGRRKPCMLIPIIGEFISAIGLILCTYFDKLPMEFAGVTEALFPALTGGWFTMLMGVFSYIADVSSEEQRTLRIGILNLCFSLGVPIGMAFSGILLKKIGFYGIFSISASLYLVAFLYGLFYVKEPVYKHKVNKDEINKKGILADFFDKKHVVEAFTVAFKKGAHQRRLRVIMLMIVVMVVIGPMHGEMAVTYLFTRFRFNWSEVEFSIFSTYGMLTSLIGTLFSVGVFSHILKMDDAIIGVISSVSKILSSFVYAFAVTNWQIYLAPIVEIFNGTSFIAMRSIASKLVASDELGKVNSLFGVAEALMPLVYGPMYTSLYAATLSTLPGAFFLLGGALTAPAVLIFLWMYKVHKGDNIRKALDDKDLNSKTKCDLSQIKFNEKDAEHQKQLNNNKNIYMITSNEDEKIIKNDIDRKSSVINAGFLEDDESDNKETTINDKVIEIVKELPPHIEHCRL